MAEAILSPIAELIIETLGSAAVEEIKALWNVEAELEALEDTIKAVKAVLIDAQKRQVRDERVRVWLQRLEDAVYLADDLLDEISTEGLKRQLMTPDERKKAVKEVCTLFSCCKLFFRHEKAREIKNVRTKLAKIAADRRDFDFVENIREKVTNVARGSGRETRSYVLRENVIGRDGDKNAILKLLLETNSHQEKVSVIPIVGLGGLGKTTLAQLVFNDESVQRHFDPKIWVCVSDIFDERFIIEKIVEIVSPDASTKGVGLERLQIILQEKLFGKRYLLVLDDVWNENHQKWKKLEELLMSCAEGSRIIVTTRSKKVADVMRTSIKPYHLNILDLYNSWSLFKKLAFDQGVAKINPVIEDVGMKIVEKCRGVPPSINVIGSMLCHRNQEDWSLFLQNKFSNISEEENNILSVLKLSYDDLPSHLKYCFAYCRLFPKDYEIDVRMLVNLWIAQGFIKPSNSSQSLEDIGYGYFMELFWRCFFQEEKRDEFDRVKKCKIHDLIHDLTIQVAGGDYAMLNLGEGSIDQRIHHVSFEFSLSSVDKIPSSSLEAKRLRSILLPNQQSYSSIEGGQGESICDLIVSNFKFLRMLDLHGLGIKKLANSIGKLKHLRYLDLSENGEMEALPICITKLVNLQTLRLNCCFKLNELPRDINKLVNLRHLEFDGCERISQMPRGFGQLTNLQTISYFVLRQSKEGTNLESRGSELDELARSTT